MAFPPTLLRQIVEEHTETMIKRKLLPRDVEGEIEQYREREEVIVLTGPRRVGKTSVMARLLRRWGGAYIDFEDERLAAFSVEDFQTLNSITEGPLFLDEVHNVRGWEKFVRRIHLQRKVVVSASNSAYIEGDYASALTGRTITFTVLPLSLDEFAAFKGRDPYQVQEDYLSTSAFPAVALTGDKSLLREYFHAILYRDVLPRLGRANPQGIVSLASYLLSNVGKPFTYRSLAPVAGVKREVTVEKYVKMLEKAYLLEVVEKWDPSLKRMRFYEKKAYGVEHGITSIFPRPSADAGRLFENAVLLNLHHLFPRHKVCFSKNGGETDFVVCEGLKPVAAFNATYELTRKNLRRETAPLERWREKGVQAFLVYGRSSVGDVEGGVPFFKLHDAVKDLLT